MATLPARADAACVVRKVSELAVTFERGFVSVPAAINGAPVTMLVDTGAEASLVTPATVAGLRLPPDPQRRSTLVGTGGRITTQNARIATLAAGGLALRDLSLTVAPLPASTAAPALAAGLLGADWLARHDVEFDLPHRRIALHRAAGCPRDHAAWGRAGYVAEATVLPGGLLALPVTLDGRKLRALLDSGANGSTVNIALAPRLGLDEAAVALDPVGRATGVAGETRATRLHRFRELRVGPAPTPYPRISLGPLGLDVADMLLGADWLRSNRVWISYAEGRVAILPVKP